MKERDIRPKKIFDKFLDLTSLDIEKYFRKSKTKINCIACGEKGKFSFKKQNFSYSQLFFGSNSYFCHYELLY